MSKGFDQIKMSKAYSGQSASTQKFKCRRGTCWRVDFLLVLFFFFLFSKDDCIPTQQKLSLFILSSLHTKHAESPNTKYHKLIGNFAISLSHLSVFIYFLEEVAQFFSHSLLLPGNFYSVVIFNLFNILCKKAKEIQLCLSRGK